MAGIISTLMLHRAMRTRAAALDAASAANVNAVLNGPLKFLRFASRVDSLAAETMSFDELSAQQAANDGADDAAAMGGSGTILAQLIAFVNAHWADIYAIILKLLGITPTPPA